jgi:tetratricopeptide (TPR) repeat protein
MMTRLPVLGLGLAAAAVLASPAPLTGQARLALAMAGASAMCGEGAPTGGGKRTVLVPGLARAHVPVTTNAEAQAFFDQGIGQLWGFDYDEAERSFAEARRRDPDCAMCAWGEALAMGPYINSGAIPAEPLAKAREVAEIALAGRERLSPRDRALVEALVSRYQPGGLENGVHGHRFARALTDLAARYPDDDFVAILAAEAIMSAQPWDYWEADGRTTKGRAAEAIALVEKVLARTPDHPQAIHLYIHLTEASADPKRAEAGADKLARLAPAAPHMVHMPSHTFYRLGRFQDSLATNRAAIAADEAYARTVGDDPRFYGYFRHHTHFILSSATQLADGPGALAAADRLEESLKAAKAGGRRYEQLHAAIVQTRALFLSPRAFLALPAPSEAPQVATLLWHGARAEAFARLGQVAQAKRELALLDRGQSRLGGSDAAVRGAVQIAAAVARGRIAEARGVRDVALRAYAMAESIESGLGYWEPPLWPIPVAITAAEARLRAGDRAGAAADYRRALAQRPGNVFAERGLAAAAQQVAMR